MWGTEYVREKVAYWRIEASEAEGKRECLLGVCSGERGCERERERRVGRSCRRGFRGVSIKRQKEYPIPLFMITIRGTGKNACSLPL